MGIVPRQVAMVGHQQQATSQPNEIPNPFELLNGIGDLPRIPGGEPIASLPYLATCPIERVTIHAPDANLFIEDLQVDGTIRMEEKR